MTEDLAKYQTDPKFTPDKAGEWNTPPEEDSWVLSHNSLRGELEEIEKALPKVVSNPVAWKLSALKSMWNYHRDHVLAHHKAEEEVIQPVMATRFQYPEKVSVIAIFNAPSFEIYNPHNIGHRRPLGTRILKRMWMH